MKKFIFILFISVIAFTSNSQYGTTWVNSGPVLFPTNVSGQINGIGRCTQMKFDPNNQNTLYVTSASGGLWKSVNNGDNWTGLGTDFFPNTQCASICIDHTNSDILYLGTGDPNYYGGGLGVWKSVDGGINWNVSNTGINTGLIIEMIMNPIDNQIIIAATDNGIYKTLNAGNTWSLVKGGGDFKSMVIKPSSVDTLYAVTSSQIWRSLNFGDTWEQITNGVTIPNNDGQGMRLAVSNANPNVVYVGMIADGGTILKSTDAGDSFTTIYHDPSVYVVGYDANSSGQGDYDYFLTCDPNDENTIYSVAHCVWKSTDGGVNWTQLTNWWEKCHTDMHGIRIHPSFNDMIYNINDGGVFLSTDGGSTWTNKSDGIAATEIYHASQSKVNRSIVSIGTQDNGELYQSGNLWYTNRGGDWGSRSVFSYDSDLVYYYENGNRRTLNGSEQSFNLPFSASNSIVLEFNRKLPISGFTALNNIFYCNDITSNNPIWNPIGALSTTSTVTVSSMSSSVADSSVLYVISTGAKIFRCDNIFATSPTYTFYNTPTSTSVASSIATIKTDPNVVYITCGSRVYRSSNKGQNFTNISAGLPSGINIIKIIYDEYSVDESVYLCTAKGVYYKNITQSTWQDISFNLPTIADIQDFMIYNPGNASSLIKVGYYGRGVWELPLNTSLPPAIDFTADKQVVCPNQEVALTDLSFSQNTIISWLWSFPGGTPSSSTLQNPTVNYNTPGSYEITLSATDANGNNSLTKTTFIQVTSAQSLPLFEGFDNFPPVSWSNYDDGADGANWVQNVTVGGYGTSSQCIVFDNYNNNANSFRDEVRTNNYNLLNSVNPKLFFDVAFARYGDGYSDTLAVLVSFNCGINFQEIYVKGGLELATVPEQQTLFTPTSNQWRTDTINLSAFTSQGQVMFAFQNRGHYGNAIYIDNININDALTNELHPINSSQINISVFPNPANDFIEIDFENVEKEKDKYKLKIVDVFGNKVLEKEITNTTDKTKIDVSKFISGMYFITINNGVDIITKKVIKK